MINFLGVAALVYLTCFGGTLKEHEGRPPNMRRLVPGWAHDLDKYKGSRQKGSILSVVGDEVKQCDVSADILSKVVSIAIIDLAAFAKRQPISRLGGPDRA